MSDIFISYARPDRDRVEALATALEAAGYAVWWDREIAVGDSFSATIESELQAAGVVVVAWSDHGVASDWVRDEAGFARRNDKFLPILFDASEAPMGFQQVQAADLSGWRGNPGAPAFQDLLASIAGKLNQPGAAALPAAPPTTRKTWPFIVAAVLALVAAAAWWQWPADPAGDSRQTQPLEEPETPASTVVTLGVLPFVNMSADPEQEYFVDGLTEEMLNWLANVEGLKVPGRTTSFMFKDQADDLRDIGRRMGVAYLLEGSVRRSGDQLRITAQLIEAETGFHLWSETWDRLLEDIFVIQDEIASEVVTKLLGALPEGTWVSPAAQGVDPQAHAHYLAGRAHWVGRNGDLALSAFDRAVAIDPDHALAWAFRAIIQAWLWGNRLTSEEQRPAVLADARESLERATALQPRSADVLFAQGWVNEMLEGHHHVPSAKSTAFYSAARRANPRHVEAMYALSRGTQSNERTGDMLAELLEVDPAMPIANALMLSILLARGETVQANSLATRTLGNFSAIDRFFIAEPFWDFGHFEQYIGLLFADGDTPGQGEPRGELFRVMALADLGAIPEAALLSRAIDSERFLSRARYNHAALTGATSEQRAAAADMGALRFWRLQDALAERPREVLAEVLAARPDLERPDPTTMAPRFGNNPAPSFGGAELTAALAYSKIGETERARQIWRVLGEHFYPGNTLTGSKSKEWHNWIWLAVIRANLGDEGAVDAFEQAYDAGFRSLMSYGNFFLLVNDDLLARSGPFAPFAGNAEFDAIVTKIQAENAKLLQRLEQRTGILAHIRRELGEAATP